MTDIHENARLTHNVHVVVGKPRPDGSIEVSTDRRYKNTATRLMTQSLAEFLAGSEHSYNRKHGRPNFISFGTMGIERQPQTSEDTARVSEDFDDPTVDPADRTFPWYESTSLALSDTCGAINIDPATGRNIHFWNPQYGWGRPYASQHPYFEGELCTECYVNGAKLNEPVVKRPPILRADVVTDCPQDLEYGADGYAYTDSTKEVISKFLTPGYLNLSVGIDYKPNDHISLYYSPVAGKMTLTNDTLYSVRYGVDAGQKTRFELGSSFKGTVNYSLLDDKLTLKSVLDLFTPYNETFGNVDVNWDVLVGLNVTSLLTVTFQSTLKYDDDIKTFEPDGTVRGAKVQFKEILGVGLSYKF